jgi:hemerythrin-like domain-containing protein
MFCSEADIEFQLQTSGIHELRMLYSEKHVFRILLGVSRMWLIEQNHLATREYLAVLESSSESIRKSRFPRSGLIIPYHLLEITMPTAQHATNAKKPATRLSTARKTKKDAIKLLTEDHNKVKKMFKEFEKLCKKGEDEGKEELAAQICKELTVHSQLEEEIFYPAVREAINDDDLMNEAVVEHASAKDLITQIQSMKVSDPMYDAVVSVLGEYVNHHIEEEQNEMFPKAQKSKVNLEEIGIEISERKEELMEE